MRKRYYIYIGLLYIPQLIFTAVKSLWWLPLLSLILFVGVGIILERKYPDVQPSRKKAKVYHHMLTWFFGILGLMFLVSGVSYLIHFQWYHWFQPLSYALMGIGFVYTSQFKK